MKEAGTKQGEVGFVFIHGAGLTSRIWDDVAQRLEYPVLQVDFPLRDGTDESRRQLTLEQYAASIRQQVERWKTRKFIIVAHSLGGVLALRLAADMPGRVAGLAAVGAAIPKHGGSFLSTLPFPKKALLSVLMRAIGTRPPESAIRSGICSGLSTEQADEVVRRFTPEAVRLYTDRVRAFVPAVPKLYVQLDKDKEFAQSLQRRMIANFAPQRTVALNAGHLPMLSDPDGLQLVLRNFLTEVVGDSCN